MKTRLIKSLLTQALVVMALPVMSQDYMNIYFKNGDFRKFYMKNITEIVASKVDTEGVQHSDFSSQCITTIYDTYVFNIEDVDSITFTKIDEEKAEENFVSAMPEVFSAIDECETIEDIEDKIEDIKNTEGVADAWSDGHQLYVSLAEGETFSFHLNHNAHEDLSSLPNVSSQIRSLLPRMEAIKPKDRNLKVVIANQQDKDEDRSSQKTILFDPLIEELNNCGVTAVYEPNPTVDFFYSNSNDPEHLYFFDYDVIILSTHGGYGPLLQYKDGKLSETKNLHNIALSETFLLYYVEEQPYWDTNYIAFDNWRKQTRFGDATDAEINYGFYQEIRNGSKVWVAHPQLTELFFQDIAQGSFSNNKSIFFNCACQSLKGDDGKPSDTFANEFFRRGLGVYMGYTETNWFGQLASYFLFDLMLQGASLSRAHELLPDYFKNETLENIENHASDFSDTALEKYRKEGLDNAELKILPEEDDDVSKLFLIPPYTEELDLTKANIEYNEKQTVTVNGSATITHSDLGNIRPGFAISCFEFGQSIIGATRFIEAEIKPVCYSNKMEFFAKFENLERGKTYQYRAYTYDGKYYNYGDFCQFTINDYPDLILAETVITLSPALCYGVQITSGSGSYIIESNTNEAAVNASINGNNVVIETVSVGDAVITIKDTKSGKTATLTVSVKAIYTTCPDSHHPHMIDLGLPSGTKWACCNVEATTPEGFGGYYAWGEISSGKSVYSWGSYQYGDSMANCENIGDNIAGTGYDVATASWGNAWKMPTLDQFQELIDNTTSVWFTQNGVEGRLFTAPNGGSIFLPAAGNHSDELYGDGERGCYWTSTLKSGTQRYAWGIDFNETRQRTYDFGRFYGLSVRPVAK